MGPVKVEMDTAARCTSDAFRSVFFVLVIQGLLNQSDQGSEM